MSWMNRFSGKEVTYQRILAAFNRRLREVPHTIAWSLNSSNNRNRVTNWKNIHSGERCFIMGNGPSLATMDLSSLKNEITFGFNRINLLFDKINFIPTYYVSIDELILEQFSEEISTVPASKFLNWNRRQYFSQDDPSIYYLKTRFPLKDYFSTDISKPLCVGSTVTYIALQIAYYMGFQEAILIGVDHSFKEKGTPNVVEVIDSETDLSHFAPNYYPKGTRRHFADLRHAEKAYAIAREFYSLNGRKILDATVDGKCPVFETADYYSIV